MTKARTDGETIEAAAILHDGKLWTVPKPGRHHDVMVQMFAAGIEKIRGETQGFITSAGRFVRREPAMRIAKQAGQILKEPTFQPRVLFSEDVW